MTPDEYVELAKCTEPDSTQYKKILKRAQNPLVFQELISLFNSIVEITNKLDKFKKHIFYGNEIDFELSSNSNEFNIDKKIELLDETLIRLVHSGMGLTTEAGEFLEALVNHFNGEELDLYNLGEELGDSCWYAAIGSDATKMELSKIMYINIKKLEKRFGNKFSEKSALIRKLDEERKILENK